MPSIPGYSDKQLASWKQQATGLVAKYDKNKNGGIDADEVKQFAYKDSDKRDNYWVGDFVNRTYTYYDVYDQLDATKVKGLDADKDGKLSADELNDAHTALLPKKDKDGDGKVSFWEKIKASFGGGSAPSFDEMVGATTESVETGRESKTEYSPLKKDWSWAPKF
jgi:hypothetical protein